jgi:hypothetical protein
MGNSGPRASTTDAAARRGNAAADWAECEGIRDQRGIFPGVTEGGAPCDSRVAWGSAAPLRWLASLRSLAS